MTLSLKTSASVDKCSTIKNTNCSQTNYNL